MRMPEFSELSRLASEHGYDSKVARAFHQALRLEDMAEKLAEGDERRKRDLLIILGPCLPTFSISTPI